MTLPAHLRNGFFKCQQAFEGLPAPGHEIRAHLVHADDGKLPELHELGQGDVRFSGREYGRVEYGVSRVRRLGTLWGNPEDAKAFVRAATVAGRLLARAKEWLIPGVIAAESLGRLRRHIPRTPGKRPGDRAWMVAPPAGASPPVPRELRYEEPSEDDDEEYAWRWVWAIFDICWAKKLRGVRPVERFVNTPPGTLKAAEAAANAMPGTIHTKMVPVVEALFLTRIRLDDLPGLRQDHEGGWANRVAHIPDPPPGFDSTIQNVAEVSVAAIEWLLAEGLNETPAPSPPVPAQPLAPDPAPQAAPPVVVAAATPASDTADAEETISLSDAAIITGGRLTRDKIRRLSLKPDNGIVRNSVGRIVKASFLDWWMNHAAEFSSTGGDPDDNEGDGESDAEVVEKFRAEEFAKRAWKCRCGWSGECPDDVKCPECRQELSPPSVRATG